MSGTARGYFRRAFRCGLTAAWVLGAIVPTARAESVTVAVAANFLSPVQALEAEFEAATGHEIVIVAASTGQLYAQIVSGAPFDVLLAADQQRPRLLAEQGRADAATQFTYAVGRMALWTREPALRDRLTLDLLADGDFRWLAIANPQLAPYGAAAQQALEALGFWQALERRIVRGENIAQTFVMAETGNAELGLVALSQAITYQGAAAYVVVPSELHDPIRQDAILLRRAQTSPAALAFMQFLRGPAMGAILERYGYDAAAE
jgi:molybdate transport system substrate-binding protein